MATTAKLDSNSINSTDSDVYITYEDQQKINKFARSNARLEDVKEELKLKENDLKNLQDAEDEMMLALDTDELVPYMVGEVFIMKKQEECQESISERRTVLENEKLGLNTKATEMQEIMSQLKADLYAKFGNNINLEADD